jgi:hypothetical protein
MTTEEVQLDRYSKFRALGQYEEFLVTGGRNVEARVALDKVRMHARSLTRSPGAEAARGSGAGGSGRGEAGRGGVPRAC